MLFVLDVILLLIGLFIIIRETNLIKKVIGLNIFQSSVFIFYLIISKVEDGVPPILMETGDIYSNPLPHVLILTAIVVSIATTSLALALIVSIKKEHKTIEEDEFDEI
ncbi:MAG: cation:proton antiporter subunit C [Pseudomonadota bacterium]|nr:cation:proton antiporter subunit C [Pseudomonadota bacterium]